MESLLQWLRHADFVDLIVLLACNALLFWYVVGAYKRTKHKRLTPGASRLRSYACLLLVIGTVRLTLSNLDLYNYGEFKVPMHLQLLVSYVLLAIAAALIRTEGACRLLLAGALVQVLFTFALCYWLPRTLASVLEVRIPHIAVAQLIIALAVAVTAMRRDRKYKENAESASAN
jgi:hypothetical protein